MGMSFLKAVAVGVGLAGLASGASAAEILVNANIAASTTWTNNNTYNLQQQIYVLPGATLTIEEGTVIASTTNLGGSLAVTKGAKIMACGTKDDPIIWTSKADVATWAVDAGHPTGKDPKTGSLREGCQEWGNLTIMGSAYISENGVGGNVSTCNASNTGVMEGLTDAGLNEYGGGDDQDDSGVIKYCSFRYGGRVVALTNELNGLSLGGVGQETDIHHVEVLNNVDDGIEVWGGCVCLRWISIWNIGDDSLDIDQGWRGVAQFGLIVQGFSCDADQGSGVGDNAIEIDGAEDSDWQPVTTCSIYNFTVIGQPVDGDGLTAWRDNARVQYRNCIFMDCGEQVVRFDNIDGDGGSGYGHNGTLSWASTWNTAYNAVPAHANDCASPGDVYKAQTSGNLAEITDSIFFRNQAANAYTEAVARDVFNPANNNVLIASILDTDSPITKLTRGAPVIKGGRTVVPVTCLDPRPQNEALTSVNWAPETEWLTSARYRGAFMRDLNWLCGWTATDAYGLSEDTSCNWGDEGGQTAGTNGNMTLTGSGPLMGMVPFTLRIRNGQPGLGLFVIGANLLNAPYKCGKLVPFLDFITAVPLDASGELTYTDNWPPNVPSGLPTYFQYIQTDNGACRRKMISNGLVGYSN